MQEKHYYLNRNSDIIITNNKPHCIVKTLYTPVLEPLALCKQNTMQHLNLCDKR